MSIWQGPDPDHVRVPPRALTLQTLVIFSGGLLLAAFVGIAASGALPLS
jgi:hypothetical protein